MIGVEVIPYSKATRVSEIQGFIKSLESQVRQTQDSKEIAPSEELEFYLEDAKESLQQVIESSKKLLKVYESGYEEIRFPTGPNLVRGLVEDPRPYTSSGENGLLILLVPLGVIFALCMFLLPPVLQALGGITIALLALGFLSIVISRSSKNTKALLEAGVTPINVFVLKASLPEVVMEKYQAAQARKLFEKIKVAGPREAFMKEQSSKDLVIYGEVSGRIFFIVAIT